MQKHIGRIIHLLCNMNATNVEGSSYYLDWLRCKSCTDKIFPVKMGAVNVNYLGREIDIPLDELVMAGQEFSDTFLLNAVADWLAEPKVLKLHVKRKKMGK